MRAASQELIAHLNGLRTRRDAQGIIADCYTFTLRTGLILNYTNADVPITLNSVVFAANSILVEGLRFKCEVGFNVDQQQITLSARQSDTIGGIPFPQAIRNGALDGAEIQRDRSFLTSWSEEPVGTVTLFKGRVGAIDSVGRTTAQIMVNSDLILLDIDMPRNLYAPNCQHVLYDSGCSLVRNAFGTNGAAEAGSTNLVINWSGASSVYAQGTLTFISGLNTGVSANVKRATSTALTVAYPLPNAPAPGDAFRVYRGCDHTRTTCASRFNNLANFRGFPYVPPPTTAL
ncbi:conserved hypothetical protein [Methylocella silvestris BL2]|uniref:Bacteriophage phiJL001 Gp84 C-terminal domain-containing protein n=2 Tax=Methylocella silvestris TaxID=199596 RepID=B8EKT8_METSB|nr:conserved hypothetical protein [Methylocella silvestris BL2]